MLMLIGGSRFLWRLFGMTIDFFFPESARLESRAASYYADPGFEEALNFLLELLGLLLCLSSYSSKGTFIVEAPAGLAPYAFF